MEVVLDLAQFRQSKSGAITGPIWIRHEATEFPDRGWNDFPVVVMSWWFNALASLISGEQAVVFRFMDGPFEFRVLQTPPGAFHVRFIERGLEEEFVIKEFSIALPKLKESVHTAAAKVLTECNRRAWTGRDVDTLRLSAAAARH